MRRSHAILLLIALATIATFSGSVGNAFVTWDDEPLIYRNPHVNAPSVQGLAWHWTHRHVDMYIPVVYSAWWMLARINQPPDPALFHAANLLVHLGSAWVVFGMLRLLIGADWPAGAGALLFAVHPLQVEAVAWATGMKDLLSGFLALVATYLYLKAARKPAKAGRWYAGATAVYLLALLAKPSTVIVPLIAGVLDVMVLCRAGRDVASGISPSPGTPGEGMGEGLGINQNEVGGPKKNALTLALSRSTRRGDQTRRDQKGGEWRRRFVWWLAPWLGAAIVIAIVAAIVQPASFVKPAPLWARPLIAADALAFYLGKLAWPMSLGIDYGRQPWVVLDSTWHGVPWLALTPLIPIALFAVLLWLRKSILIVAALIFFIGLLPVLGLRPFSFQAMSTVADRYVYLAMLGPALAAAWGVKRYAGWASAACCAVLLVALAVRSHRQVQTWRDSETLYRHSIQVNPRSFTAHNNLGVVLMERNDKIGAVEQFQAALAIRPNDADAYRYIADTALAMGDLSDGLEYVRRLLQSQASLPSQQRADPVELRRWLGEFYLKYATGCEHQGDVPHAREGYQQAAEYLTGEKLQTARQRMLALTPITSRP